MVAAAGIVENARAAEILNIIANNATDEEVRAKAWAPDATLENIKAWTKAREIQNKCLKIAATRQNGINAVKVQEQPMERPRSERCFRCGTHDFPHRHGTTCPAIGKTCRQCGKEDHFAAICMQSINNRPENRDSYSDTRQPRYQGNNTRGQHDYRRRESNGRSTERYGSTNREASRDSYRNARQKSNERNNERHIFRIQDAKEFEQFQAWKATKEPESILKYKPDKKVTYNDDIESD